MFIIIIIIIIIAVIKSDFKFLIRVLFFFRK